MVAVMRLLGHTGWWNKAMKLAATAERTADGFSPHRPTSERMRGAEVMFESILFPGSNRVSAPFATKEPECFRDLGLDQIVETLTASREEYELPPIYWTAVRDSEVIEYRQGVYTDLAHPAVHHAAAEFAEGMRLHRARFVQASRLFAREQRPFWVLSAIVTHQGAVRDFARVLKDVPLRSAGMLALRDWLDALVTGQAFTEAVERAADIRSRLDEIHFTVRIDGLRVEVAPFADQPDYSAEVEATFARFKQGEVKDHRVRYTDYVDADRVEEGVLRLVGEENQHVFAALDQYVREYACSEPAAYLDPTVARVDRELQFYLSYLEHLAPMVEDGLEFCMPRVSASKAVSAQHTFDLALAEKLDRHRASMVTNDFELREPERLIVVTGANQGGKTTFSRTFGQLHWLAELGLPVPGSSASLFLFDALFTHYEKQEDISNLRGKLEDELVRIRKILEAATSDSVVIMNEIFNSTTLDDSILLGTAVLKQIIERDILAVCVTFVDELTTLSDTTVSMVAAVDPAEPTKRTFKLERRPADGLAYALALADKYRLRNAQVRQSIEGTQSESRVLLDPVEKGA
jgi:hypothetical protein